MRRMVQVSILILLCLLFAGCHTGGIKYTQGEDETGEWYITDGEYRYILLMPYWSCTISRFDTYIGTIEDSNMKLYANARDANRVLLQTMILFHDDNLALLVREDLIPDATKEKVSYIRVATTVVRENGVIENDNIRIIDDAVAIEQLNSLLFSQERGIQASAYELIMEAGWSEVYSIHYFYAQTDQIFIRQEILLSPENEYYLPVLSGEYLKIEDARLKELITGIPLS